MLSILFGCSQNGDVVDNQLKGTKWIYRYSDEDYYVLEFISENDVVGYIADDNFIMSGNPSNSKYSLIENQVEFNSLIIKDLFIFHKFKSAMMLNNSMMSVNIIDKVGDDGEWDYEQTWIFNKQ